MTGLWRKVCLIMQPLRSTGFLFPSLYLYSTSLHSLSALISSQSLLGCFAGSRCELHFVSFGGPRIAVLKIAISSGTFNRMQHKQIHKSHFFLFLVLCNPPILCQINMQAGVGGGALAAWWGYMLHCYLSREDNDEVHSAPIKAAASRPMD